ncbi:translocase of chloroplast 159, chloroplastic [Raphanus sativus]|uniref:Translocase of chloroplast 159, chloroplastic n=1 Tax=Raphanus sativus TaxID=3726 RepID=A0A6J0L8U5_RAPSA|nr:translocase of chloroplast 159, chloroplastic [Raphanus sativus]
MDSKAVTPPPPPPPEQNPFIASGPSGKTYASVVAAAAAASKDGGAATSPKELDSSPSGDSDKGGADGVSVAEKPSSEVGSDKELAAASSLSPEEPEAVSEETAGGDDVVGVTEDEDKKGVDDVVEGDGESKLGNESVDADEKVSDEAASQPETVTSKPEAVSEKATGEDDKKVEEGVENGSLDVGEKQASTDGVVGGADKEEEEKSSLEGGADEKVSDAAASLLSPEPEAVSEKATGEDDVEENKKVEEAVSDKITGEDDVGATQEENKKVEEDADDVDDNGQSGKTYAAVVAAAASKDGEAVSSEKEFASSTEAVSGDSDKGIVGEADKEEKSSLEVGADEKVSDEAGSPDTASSLSPEPEAVSEKTTEENKKVTEGVDDVEDNEQSGKTNASVVEDDGERNLENKSVDVAEKQASTEVMVDENPEVESESKATVVEEEAVVPKSDDEVTEGGGTNEEQSEFSKKVYVDDKIEEESAELTNTVVDSSTVESVHVDVAKPGVAIVGDVEGIEEVKINADGENLEVANKFDQLGDNDGGGFEVESNKSVEEVGEKLTSGADSIADSSKLEFADRSAAEAEDVAAKELSEAARVEPDEPKVGGAEEELHASESLTVDSVDAREDSDPAAELQSEPNSNPEARKVSEGNIAEEDGDKIPVADIVSSREFSLEGKEVDHEPSGGEGVIGVDRSDSEEETEEMIFGSSEAARQFLAELEKASSGIEGHSDEANISNNMSDRIDGQIVTDSDEDVDTEDEGEEKMFDSEALAALLKAATGGGSSEGGNFTITSQDGTKLFSMDRPAGLSSSLRPLKPAAAPRAIRPNIFSNPNVAVDESEVNLSEEEKQKLEKLQSLRVKFLRLLQRLGQSAEDSIAAQVLYRIALLAGRQTGQLFSLDAAKKKAVEYEAEGNEELNFSLNILVLGKAGVGKSATINSILGNQKASTDAFGLSTNSVREVSETVGGIKITFIDTPGLKPAAMDQSANSKMLSSVKKVMKRCPPDIVLYVDRLDTQNRDLNNLPLLKTVTASLGASIWKNAIVTLTHAASAPPDGPSGAPLSYDVFVAQCSHIVQQSIGQAVGDLRLMNPSLMNPVSLVENHPLCRKNREGVKVLPNGQTWRPQLLLLCYSLKVLSEANSLLKPQEPLDQRKLFGFRVRSPPLPYLLSSLLQSRAHPKLSTDQGGDSVDSDIEIDDVSDSEQEDGDDDEYDQLPPFKPLRKTQLAKLSKDQRKAYLEEYDYRVKLLQKKQWREELKRMREMKKNGKKVGENEFGYPGEEEDPENGAPAAVPVPLPDMVLPPSFDSDNSAYRYRFLEPTSQLLTRPVLDTHGWDHDCGYDGVNAEYSLAIASRFPATATVQTTKDKKEFNIHLDSSVSAKHGESGSTMAGFDIQNVGKQLAYVVRGETKFKNLKKNKTTLGGSVTFLGENIATGVKVEDQIALGKRFVLVGSTGTMRSQGDAAYGANLEVRLKEADFPIGQDQHSLGLSLVKWRGDLALGGNLQSQVSVGRNSKIALRAGLNNKMSGQITVRTSSSDQLQIALTAILPIAMSIYKLIRPEGASDKYSMY